MFDKMAIVGDADIIFPLKTLGLKVYSPKNADDTRKILASLEKENVALCFLHESLLVPLEKEREDLRKKICPVVMGFSDFRVVTDYLGQIMRNMAVKATGSDSLVKRRGKDETR